MSKPSGVSYISDRNKRSYDTDNARPAEIRKICDIVVRDVHAMLQSMFDGIDDSFFELANNARTNNEQNRFFEAMRDIRIKRRTIESDFKDGLEQLFSFERVLSTTENKSPNTNHPGLDSLSLVKNDDLEEDVAISSMSTKASANFQGPLLQFHTRIGNLYGAQSLEEISPPLAPKDLAEIFSLCCQELEIELKEKLIVYKQFDRYVLSNLGTVLDEANKTLIRLGIMPSLKQTGAKQNIGPRVQAPSNPIPQQANTQAESEALNNALPQLQSLLANIRNNFGPQALGSHYNPNLPTQYIGTQDLISLLSSIQNIEPLQSSSDSGRKVVDIHAELQNQLRSTGDNTNAQPKFKQIDEDLINLVSMLFEFILEDYNLAAPIQVLISRLQIPILKVVIQDNSFFSSNKHPARKLLNSLAKAGIGWNPNQNKGDSLYQAINDTVQTILSDFDGDISLFDRLNQDFDAFMHKEERKSKIVEQRTKESEIGQIKSRQAQKAVEDKLDLLLNESKAPVPEVIVDIIKGGWSRVMFLSFLKDAQEHQWERSCKTVENLIWCLQGFEKPKDRQYWIAIAPKVLKELKSGLEEVSYNASGLEQTLVEARAALTNAFKQNSFNLSQNITPPDYSDTLNNPPVQSAIEKQRATQDSKLNKYIEQINHLEVGTWFEFLAHGSKQRCKLSAIINDADSYIFVNRMGLKACEKKKLDLAEDLYKQQAVILEQGLLIDRAMTALTSNLRQKANTL